MTPFALFGLPHLATLLLIGVAGVATYQAAAAVRRAGTVRSAARFLGTILLAVEPAKMWLAISVYGEPWPDALPLHLCRIAMVLCAIMLMLRSYRLFEVSYFWIMGGSGAALLTPDLAHGFPHPLYFVFFGGHALAVLGVLFALSGFGFRPRLRSIALTAAASAAYMALMVPVNWLLDTNFLYLRGKPPSPSLYDYLGPWPWYLFSVWALGLVVCFVCYAPFAGSLRRRAS